MLIFHNNTFAEKPQKEGTNSEHVAARGQGTSSPETLQQESPADGLEQKKRALQQPLSFLCASPLPLTHFFSYFLSPSLIVRPIMPLCSFSRSFNTLAHN